MRTRTREREGKMVFYTQSTSAVISGRETDRQRQTDRQTDRHRERERVNWCFTPSQPVRLYQGQTETDRDRQRERERDINPRDSLTQASKMC